MEAARQAERLTLARELHDVVAHHVTGIVVQSQALRRVAATRPELVIDTLPQIEHAGIAALTAMRQLLTALRTPQEAAPHRTVDLRADLHRIIEAAGVPGRLHLALDQATLPTTIGLTVERVITETLTNAARYAPDANTVDVAVETRPDSVRIEVTDDGTGHATFPGGAGYGLVGLDERVQMLGGTLTAGPTNGSGGWRVVATLPILEPS